MEKEEVRNMFSRNELLHSQLELQQIKEAYCGISKEEVLSSVKNKLLEILHFQELMWRQ